MHEVVQKPVSDWSFLIAETLQKPVKKPTGGSWKTTTRCLFQNPRNVVFQSMLKREQCEMKF